MSEWKSYIDVVEPGTLIGSLVDFYVLQVNGIPILATTCDHMARHIARLLDNARREYNRKGKHNAMHILTEQIGLGEEYAEDILWALYTGSKPRANYHPGTGSIN